MQYGYVFESLVYFKVANQTVSCNKSITYYPNPSFSNFTTTKTGDAVRITIQVRLSPARARAAQERNNKVCCLF